VSDASSSNTIVVIDQLRVQYGNKVAVDDLSLSIHPGEFVGFIGPNGAGKSSTMRSIVGLQVPDKGTVSVAGHDVMRAPVEARRALGYVAQDLELYRYLTGNELLRFVGEVRGVSPELLEERVTILLELCDLGYAKDRMIREYSGGMARKIALAAALVDEPKLLLLDESFVGMDPESTFRFRTYLKGFTERGGAILLSSHILDMLERICSRIVILNAGKVVRDLSQDELQAVFSSGEARDLTELYLQATGQHDLIAAFR